MCINGSEYSNDSLHAISEQRAELLACEEFPEVSIELLTIVNSSRLGIASILSGIYGVTVYWQIFHDTPPLLLLRV